ncbi:MAG: MFS transporter [Chloroflexota bacterium]|nr:MFS transporter [Chloroflexota bacterium]
MLRGFLYIVSADFIVRAAYQMGKTPLLPIFAASLGATGAFLGFIVSVSTLTGMVLKPFIGILSDRWGQRLWLVVGTMFFIGVPFIYRFVHTPEELFAIRLIHGLATAIYGPVTLAYVAAQSEHRRAERLGWFTMARNAGYIIGPATAGGLLLVMSPVSVFTIVGLLSCLAMVPVLLLPESKQSKPLTRITFREHFTQALTVGIKTPAVWLAGSLEASVYMSLYALKTFLPINALASGVNVGLIGVFFAVQGATHMLLSPLGGRISDRIGYSRGIAIGMLIQATALFVLSMGPVGLMLLMSGTLLGASQALVLPSTIALVSRTVGGANIATGMGLVGSLRNGGKVAGPTLVGGLIMWFGFPQSLQLMGWALMLGALAISIGGYFSRRLIPGTDPLKENSLMTAKE